MAGRSRPGWWCSPTGLNVALRRNLGIERRIISRRATRSRSDFDIEPVGRPAFDFPAMTYFPERASDRDPLYLTLFPIGDRMRANLFAYREADDPWLREMRRSPVETINAVLPRLRRITGEYAVPGEINIRPADLYVRTGLEQCRRGLVGDAFATTCPVSRHRLQLGISANVVQLCSVHIPAWLATDGMGEDKIATFYADPVKRACDAWSTAKKGVPTSARSRSTTGFTWRAQRWARFLKLAWRPAMRRRARVMGNGRRSEPRDGGAPSSSSSTPRPARVRAAKDPGLWLLQCPGTVTKAIAQTSQALVGKLTAGLDVIAERFSRSDIEEHVDHGAASGPQLAHETVFCGAGIDRLDIRPGKQLFGDPVDEQRARRIFGETGIERGLPGIGGRSAIHHTCAAMAAPSTRSSATDASCRAARSRSRRRTNAASRGSDNSAVPRSPFQLAFSIARKVSNASSTSCGLRLLTTSTAPSADNLFQS